MAEPLLIFRGEVHCKCSAGVPGLTLSGYTSAHPETRTTLAFSAAAPAEFPATLQDALIEQLPEGSWRIKSATREWRTCPCTCIVRPQRSSIARCRHVRCRG
jgi:hypothetical protein